MSATRETSRVVVLRESRQVDAIILIQRGLTHRQVANVLGIRHSTVARWIQP